MDICFFVFICIVSMCFVVYVIAYFMFYMHIYIYIYCLFRFICVDVFYMLLYGICTIGRGRYNRGSVAPSLSGR